MFKLHASCLPSLGWCYIVYFSAACSVFRLWFSVGYICSCSALPYHTCLFGRFPAVTRVKMIGKEGSLTFKEVNLRDSTFSVPMVPPIYLLFFLPFPLFFIQCFFFFIKVICIHCRNPEKYKKLWGGKKKKITCNSSTQRQPLLRVLLCSGIPPCFMCMWVHTRVTVW